MNRLRIRLADLASINGASPAPESPFVDRLQGVAGSDHQHCHVGTVITVMIMPAMGLRSIKAHGCVY